MSATVVIAEKNLVVEPGSSVTTSVTIGNTGSVVDQFTVEVLGVTADYASVEPASIRLFPGTNADVTVTFSPPRDFNTEAGAQPFGVRATPQENAAGVATDEGVVQVGRFSEVVGELVPRTIRGRRSARTELAVDNRGNVTLDLDIEGVDPEGAVEVQVDNPRLAADPGTATFVTIDVKPARIFWRGQPKTYPFSVSIREEGAVPVIVDGTMLQDPILPKWFWKAVLALLALLLLAALLWHYLLKPEIEAQAISAAKKQNEEQAEAVTDAAEQAAAAGAKAEEAKKAAEAAEAAAGGGTPADGGSTTTTSSTTTPAMAKPTDFRLGASAGPGTTQAVTKDFAATNEKFSLTDIVLQNPNGDSGIVTITRGTSPTDVVLVVNLDNFRDLDYHYVAPIAFNKQALVLRVTCTAPGTAGGTPAATCTPAASISGYLSGP